MRALRNSAMAIVLALVAPATAQQLDVAIVADCVPGQAACYATSRVAGLKSGGDGFLAVRTGPGSDFRKIDELYNGDVVEVIEFAGKWRGVRYRDGRLGWVHSNWLRDLAG